MKRAALLLFLCVLGCDNIAPQPRGSVEVLAFSASYCSGCVKDKTEIARMKASGAPIRTIDCASEVGKSEAGRYGITELPTYILIVGGVESARTSDVYTVRKWCGR